MALPGTSKALLVLGAILLALAIFLAYTAARPEVLLYGIFGAALCVGLALFFRKNRMRPLFEPRMPEAP